MNQFRLTDTIVALSSGAGPAARGIIRLSGAEARRICAAVCSHESLSGPRPLAVAACISQADETRVGSSDATYWPSHQHPSPTSESIGSSPRAYSKRLTVWDSEVPALLLCFTAPRSYSGEDLIEIHTVGSRPLLAELVRLLVAAGARPAGPGEFSARALRNGRLSLDQVDGVLSLIHARDAAEARLAARVVRGEFATRLDAARDALLDLLARVEAGIDFVDEEGVTFVTPAEIRAGLREPIALLRELAVGPRQARVRETPHVGVFGLPNAGKSTLVNALLGHARVIESPIAGATRDVIAAAHTVAGLHLMLQDTPGLGASADPLDQQAYLAARVAASEADVVVWVHAATTRWTDAELATCHAVSAGRELVLCVSQCNAAGSERSADPILPALDGLAETAIVRTSAHTGDGLADLETALANAISRLTTSGPAPSISGFADRAREALGRIEGLLGTAPGSPVEAQVSPPWELIAMELREAIAAIESRGHFATTDDMLGRIFSRFCVGK